MAANCWSLLPHSTILKVANCFTTIEDFLSFSLVCRSWGTVYASKTWSPELQFPWLMLSEEEDSKRRGFYSVYNSRRYKLLLPEAQGRMCWGTSLLGWIITLGSDLKLHLLNPVSRALIGLPPLPQNCMDRDHWYRLIYKAVAFRDSDGSFLVAVIHYQTKSLLFSKPSDTTWVTVESPTNCHYNFSDAVWFEDRIYAVYGLGTLVQIDVDGTVTHVVGPPQKKWAWEHVHLVQSSRDLLMVQKLERRGDDAVEFLVYKFEFLRRKWVELEELGDRAIFVGGNHSMAMSIEEEKGCGGNCIYFTGDGPEQWWHWHDYQVQRDMGVYNMGDESVEPFYYGADYPCHYSSPLWVVPRF